MPIVPRPLNLFLLVAIFAYLSTTTGAYSGSDKEIYEHITTLSGKTYENCRVRAVTPHEISIYHTRGIARIPFSDLPRNYQLRYGYDPEKEAAYLRRVEETKEKIKQQQRIQEWYENIKDFTGEGLDNEIGVGKYGTIKDKIKIIQIIDDNNFLASLPLRTRRKETVEGRQHTGSTWAESGSSEFYRSLYRVRPSRSAHTIERETVWFSGINTEHITDGQEITLSGVFKVSSTKQYKTALGTTNTVLMLEPVILSHE